jgi:S-methylmethionine-dependent homocysteine/selenocysteine methylase
MTIPNPGGRGFVSDGGLETDLIHHYGFQLREFAAFPLVETTDGRQSLDRYWRSVADIARRADAGLLLEAPTWRANADWGARVGYDAAALDRVNRAAVELLTDIRRRECADLAETAVVGIVGPRGDGYIAGDRPEVSEAAAYHRPQLASFADAGADFAAAYTMTGPEEALGIATAANEVGLPIAISFTVETDGRLPDGTSLAAAIERVDATANVAYFGINCAHPSHIAAALTDDAWTGRIGAVLPNASTKMHAELDAMEELDEGDPDLLAAEVGELRCRLPSVAVVGGCCGTDARHVAAMWGVAAPDRGRSARAR